MQESFSPKASGITNISASGTSATSALSGAPGKGKFQVRVANLAAVVAYIRFGNGSQTAVTTDMALQANATEVFTVRDVTDVGVILASSTGTVQFTVGVGL